MWVGNAIVIVILGPFYVCVFVAVSLVHAALCRSTTVSRSEARTPIPRVFLQLGTSLGVAEEILLVKDQWDMDENRNQATGHWYALKKATAGKSESEDCSSDTSTNCVSQVPRLDTEGQCKAQKV